MKRYASLFSAIFLLIYGATAWADEYSSPWESPHFAIIIDPFSGNSIDWDAMNADTRVVAIVHKASQGLRADPTYSERRQEALRREYLWGSYHLLTNIDIRSQIDRYLDISGINDNETYALDIECLAGQANCQYDSLKVSPAMVRRAALYFKERTGHLPLIYANHAVTTVLAREFRRDVEMRHTKLWYARFKSNIDVFPFGPWQTYTIWQFSSEINCEKLPGNCPYRIPGTKNDLDINVYNGSVEQLKANWPLR